MPLLLTGNTRTIQGLTKYFLSIYQQQHWRGIRVVVAPNSVVEKQFVEEILQIEVMEAPVSSIKVNSYGSNQVRAEEGYLKSSTILEFSPIKVGKVANIKALDDFVDFLNLDPDRYVAVVVGRGDTPNSLSLNYNI